MTDKTSRSQLVSRRGELMAELFLQELEPAYIARSAKGMHSDFLVGFTNELGGINTFAVQVKTTEQPIPRRLPIARQKLDRMRHSNVPVILLVADAKRNSLSYVWLPPEEGGERKGSHSILIPMTAVDEAEMRRLRKRLAASDLLPAGTT